MYHHGNVCFVSNIMIFVMVSTKKCLHLGNSVKVCEFWKGMIETVDVFRPHGMEKSLVEHVQKGREKRCPIVNFPQQDLACLVESFLLPLLFMFSSLHCTNMQDRWEVWHLLNGNPRHSGL